MNLNNKENYIGTALVRDNEWDFKSALEFIESLSEKDESKIIYNLNRLGTNEIMINSIDREFLFMGEKEIDNLIEREAEKKRSELAKAIDEKIGYLVNENKKLADCYEVELSKVYEGVLYALSLFETFDLPFDDIEDHLSKAKEALDDLGIDTDMRENIEKGAKYTAINDISLFEIACFSDVEFSDVDDDETD